MLYFKCPVCGEAIETFKPSPIECPKCLCDMFTIKIESTLTEKSKKTGVK